MKITLAVAALIGLIKANSKYQEPVWTLASVQNHRADSDVQKAYGDHSTTQADARPPYQSATQM